MIFTIILVYLLQIIVDMAQSKVFFEITIPPNYNFRYTISFLMSHKSLTEGREKREITDEILKLLNKSEGTAMKVDMFNKYMGEREPKWGELSEARKEIIANYFGIENPDWLVTEQVFSVQLG